VADNLFCIWCIIFLFNLLLRFNYLANIENFIMAKVEDHCERVM